MLKSKLMKGKPPLPTAPPPVPEFTPTDNGSLANSENSDSPNPELLNRIESLLKRPLDAQERVLINHVTPQGVAKINRDYFRGIPVEQTLAELYAVFKMMLLHRNLVDVAATRVSRMLMAKMGRPLSVAEASFLARSAPNLSPELLAMVTEQCVSENFAMIVEECVFRNVDESLMATIRTTSANMKIPVSFIHLAPTTYSEASVQSSPDGLCINHFACIHRNRVEVRLNPITSWFHSEESSQVNLSSGETTNAAQVINGSGISAQTLALRSCLKGSPTSSSGRVPTPPTSPPLKASRSFRVKDRLRGMTHNNSPSINPTPPAGPAQVKRVSFAASSSPSLAPMTVTGSALTASDVQRSPSPPSATTAKIGSSPLAPPRDLEAADPNADLMKMDFRSNVQPQLNRLSRLLSFIGILAAPRPTTAIPIPAGSRAPTTTTILPVL